VVIEIVAFDFDGTIIDSNLAKAVCFEKVFARFGPEAGHEAFSFHMSNLGQSREEKIRMIGQQLDLGLGDKEVRLLCDDFAMRVVGEVKRCPLVKGFREALMSIDGQFPLFIVSATPEKELRGIVAEIGLRSHFEEVIGHPTPKDAALLSIAENHNVSPNRVLLVGDSENDLVAARCAGTEFFMISSNSRASYAGLVALLSDNVG